MPGYSGPGTGPKPFDTGQPGSAGETQLNLVSDGGRGVVARGRLGTRCGGGFAARIPGQLAGAGRVWAGRSRQSKRSKQPGRWFVASEEKEERERKKRGPPRIPGPRPTGAVKIRNVPKKPCPVCAAWTSADPTDRTKGKLVPHDRQEPRRSSLLSSQSPVLALGTSKANPEPGAAAAPAQSKGF